MGITPVTKLRGGPQILVTDIEAADVADLLVNHHDLAMQVIVQPRGRNPLVGLGVEGLGIPAQLLKVGEEAVSRSSGPAQVIEHLDGHAPLCRCLQRFQDPFPQIIRIEGIKLHVDLLLCVVDIIDQLIKELVAIGEDVNLVIKGNQGPIEAQRKADQLPGPGKLTVGNQELVVPNPFLLPFNQFLAKGLLLGPDSEDIVTRQLPAHEQVDDKADHRKTRQDQEPSPGRGDVAPGPEDGPDCKADVN